MCKAPGQLPGGAGPQRGKEATDAGSAALLGSAGVVGGLERMATAAARNGVWIVDREASAHESVDVVDFGALEIANAVLVDDNPDSVALENFVAVLNRGVEGHSVLKSRAPAGRHEDTQSSRRIGLLLDKLLELIGSVRR